MCVSKYIYVYRKHTNIISVKAIDVVMINRSATSNMTNVGENNNSTRKTSEIEWNEFYDYHMTFLRSRLTSMYEKSNDPR